MPVTIILNLVLIYGVDLSDLIYLTWSMELIYLIWSMMLIYLTSWKNLFCLIVNFVCDQSWLGPMRIKKWHKWYLSLFWVFDLTDSGPEKIHKFWTSFQTPPYQIWYCCITLHKKWSFPLRISSVNVTNPQETTDLVTFTKEILSEKLHYLFSVKCGKQRFMQSRAKVKPRSSKIKQSVDFCYFSLKNSFLWQS